MIVRDAERSLFEKATAELREFEPEVLVARVRARGNMMPPELVLYQTIVKPLYLEPLAFEGRGRFAGSAPRDSRGVVDSVEVVPVSLPSPVQQTSDGSSRATAAVRRYAEQAREGDILAEQVLEGYVSKVDGDQVIVEFKTPHGYANQLFTAEQFGGALPQYGAAVRVVAHLLTAPDQVRDTRHPLPPLEGEYERAEPIDREDGEYRIGE